MARKGKSTEEIIAFLREAEVRLAQGETAGKIGLPHEAVPGIRLESGRCWPASGLTGAQRRAEQTLAARSSRAPVVELEINIHDRIPKGIIDEVGIEA